MDNLLLGLVFAVIIHYVTTPNPLKFNINIIRLITLMLFMCWELVRSSLDVAWDVLTPSSKSQSKIVNLRLQCKHPVQISLLANLISLTPGTLTVEIIKNNTELVIHIMFAQRQQEIITFIKEKLEPKIIKAVNYE